MLASAKINEDMFRIVSSAKSHCLSINPEKTSVLLFGPQKLRDRALPLRKLKLQGRSLSVSESSRNLGVTFDTSLRFHSHVNSCIRVAYNNLKMIYNNRYFLNRKTKLLL